MLTLSESEFLCGATHADPWCYPSFRNYINDIDQVPAPGSVIPIPGHPDYALAHSSDSTLLLYRGVDGNQVVGYYNFPGAVCIHATHQGKGLGAELILHAALVRGGPPSEGLDEQLFSEAGLRAHRAAWRLGVARGLIRDPLAPSPSR